MRYLILGLGEVGMTVADKLLSSKNKAYLHLHSKSKQKIEQVKLQFNASKKPNVKTSFGDLFGLKEISTSTEFLNYLYSNKTSNYELSTIYQLIKTAKPDIVIDTISLTTHFKKDYMQIMFENLLHHKKEYLIEELLLNDASTIITKFIYALRIALKQNNVSQYLKVSTCGLGGMGFNCPYSHGDKMELELSGQLKQKITVSGIFHQYLWNLADSESTKISLIIPKTLIGWDEPRFRKHGSSLTTEAIDIVVIPCGDSTYYSVEEVIVAGAIGQFESITKEEVTKAIFDTLNGNMQHNILTMMDKASLNSSYQAGKQQQQLIFQARMLELKNNKPSLVSGNLGSAVSKLIVELYVLKQVIMRASFDYCNDPKHLSTRSYDFIKKNPYILRQIQHANLSVKFLNGFSEKSSDSAIKNRECSLIDITPKRISTWLNFLQAYADKCGVDEPRKILETISIGELIALYLATQGKCRKNHSLNNSQQPLRQM